MRLTSSLAGLWTFYYVVRAIKMHPRALALAQFPFCYELACAVCGNCGALGTDIAHTKCMWLRVR